MDRGYCLVDFQIKSLIEDKKLIIPSDGFEDRVQPASYDPIIGNEIFILDTEEEGIFKPEPHESVYNTLLRLPRRQRKKIDISGGFELKKGFTYLAKLEERIILNENESVKSSPKSSFGRLFLNTRMITDYNLCYDEINAVYNTDSVLDLWLLIQPLAFNVIAHPGLSFNQLRFFKGLNARLNSLEIKDEFEKNPLLCYKEDDGTLTPVDPVITDDGLQVHSNSSGINTEGIIGLRARHNPNPIDLSKKEEYEAEDFFEPLIEKNKIKEEECYLIATKEVLKIPPNLSVELKSHSHIGIMGPLHFAGFVDPGFTGDLVLEVRSGELAAMALKDNMPISRLEVFRNAKPEKIYGEEINSNYQKQVGPRPAKFFKEFNFKFAARNYDKLDRIVLVQEAETLLKHRNIEEGFEFVSYENSLPLFEDIEKNGFFQSRYDCEPDELILQPIPYILMFGPDRTVFKYVRASDLEKYGDTRLFGKTSIGVGGHILKTDGPEFIMNCIQREVFEEEVNIEGKHSGPMFVGTFMSFEKPVDRVHFGLIYGIMTKGDITYKEESFASGEMVPIYSLTDDPLFPDNYETWSRMLVPHLDEIYDKCS